jgi:sugar/nucleoside kinase (ribokinase family)
MKKNIGPFYLPYVVGIESVVTDKVYPGGQDELAEIFFSELHRLIPSPVIPLPHAIAGGDNITVLANDFHRALHRFGIENGLVADQGDEADLDAVEKAATIVAAQLFGQPSIAPGGALANSLAAMFANRINGNALVDGVFITAVGDDEMGHRYVRESGKHIIAATHGRQMEAHIIPMGKDNRLIVACPRNAHENSMDAITPEFVRTSLEHAQQRAFGQIDRLMIGGYLHLLGDGYAEVMETIIGFVEELPEDKRPDVVMTLASHEAAENAVLREAFYRLSALTNVTVHANTGEFRRLIHRGMGDELATELGEQTFDSVWRLPYQDLWFDEQGAPLQGKALDAAKRAVPDYMHDKQAANERGFDYAMKRLCQSTEHEMRFVVTDGGKPPVIITSNGWNRYDGLAPYPDNQPMYTVGAGDAFAGGFQAMELYQHVKRMHRNRPEQQLVNDILAGHVFAQQVLEVPSARAPERHIISDCRKEQVAIDGPMADWGLIDIICEGMRQRKRA